MKRTLCTLYAACLLALCLLGQSLSGQRAFAAERQLCPDGGNCTDNDLRVVFPGAADDGNESNTRALKDAEITMNVATTVVADNEAQGWSIGLEHDTAKLELLEVTTEGLALPSIFFDTTTMAVGDPAPGFISAVVLAIFPPPGDILPVGDHAIVIAKYKVLVDLDPDVPTLIAFTDELVPNPGSPATATNFTIQSNTRKPKRVTDGELRAPKGPPGGCSPWALYYGDVGDGSAYNITGNGFVITMRNAKDVLGLSFGAKKVGNDYSLVNEGLGAAAGREVEMIITDVDGDTQTPSTNTATDTLGPRDITRVEEGAAISGFAGDFFNADIAPAVGGPGFTVGYVVDVSGTGNVIPVTAPAAAPPCPLNEIIKVSFEVGLCPAGYGLFFGPDATVANFAAPGAAAWPITMRNPKAAIAFSFGVKNDNGSLTFVDKGLGALAGREVELIITDEDGATQKDLATNTASGATAINSVVKGAALIAITEGDFLTVDRNPAVGAPGFTVGYVADVTGTGASIPLTATNEACPENEILIVNGAGTPDFFRGDCDGNGMLNVSDGAINAQNIFLNRIKFFDCNDMLDANDDGNLDGTDPIVILGWVFLGDPDLPAPFFSCGPDPTDDDALDCKQSNCGP